MRTVLGQRPSPAMVVACLALAVALAGTGYAAIRLPANSVGTKQLRKNAVTSRKVKNNALTGADISEASLGQVPSAASAANATSAGHATSSDQATNASHASSADQATNASHASSADQATNASHASSADQAGTANAAFSTYHATFIPLPDSLAAIATLGIPTPGNYVVNAKLWAYNATLTPSGSDSCVLRAEGDNFDLTLFDVDADVVDDQEVVALQGVHRFTAPGQVSLHCTDAGVGDVQASNTKITAVQVAQLTNTPF